MDDAQLKRALLEQALKPAMHAIGADLLGQAQREAPVDEGTLRGSGRYDVTEEGDTVVLEVSFNTPYAAKQHEDTHLKHPKGGKAKYLSDPFKAMMPRYVQAVAAAARKVMS